MAEIIRNPHDSNPHDRNPHGKGRPDDRQADADAGLVVNPSVSHERRDVNIFQISAFGIGLLLSCIVVVFAMWAMFHFLAARENAKNASNPAAAMMNQRPQLPPEPR